MSNGSTLSQDLFKVKESHDKGLADQETGSEVYLSELLVSIYNKLNYNLGWI